MYISRVTINEGSAFFRFLERKGSYNGYADHQLLWQLFPNDGNKKRDFIFRKESKEKIPSYLLVSKDQPVANDILSVHSKPYYPQLKNEQELHFSLIANPVVSRITEGRKRSVKHDIWMDAKFRAREKGLSEQELREYCEKEAKSWLIIQGEKNGFAITPDAIDIESHSQNVFYKKKNKINISSIHYAGILVVKDFNALVRMLYKGLGRSKGFGYGLMLVRKTNSI
jgi:CRISPR system Cascade subunit CasE